MTTKDDEIEKKRKKIEDDTNTGIRTKKTIYDVYDYCYCYDYYYYYYYYD